MAEVNFYLRKATKADAPCSVLLYFSYAGERFKVGAVDKIEAKYWDPNNQRAKQNRSFETFPEFNQRLVNIASFCMNIYRGYLNDHGQQQPSPTVLRSLFKDVLSPDKTIVVQTEENLFGFIEQFIEDARGRLNAKTGKPLSNASFVVYQRTLDLLKEFALNKRRKLNFEDITYEFYLDFTQYLSVEHNFATNTVGKHIKTLKTFLNEATERGINTSFDFKSKRFRVARESVDSIYLSVDELDILLKLDLSRNTRLERVRDLFLVGCFTGLRFSDFNNLAKECFILDNGEEYIEIETQKTRRKVVIPVFDQLKQIRKRYADLTDNQLPPSMSNQKMNQYLKEIGQLAGFTDLEQTRITKKGKEIIQNVPKYTLISTHTARRSFATNMYLLGVPSYTIMAITSHTTEKSFLQYIKVTPKEHAVQMREIVQRQAMKIVG